jgi:hypothetical protein
MKEALDALFHRLKADEKSEDFGDAITITSPILGERTILSQVFVPHNCWRTK